MIEIATRSIERRQTRRYSIEIPLAYRILKRRRVIANGAGRTINVSSGGVLFATDGQILKARQIELLIHWPAAISETCGLNLGVRGEVIRIDGQWCAVRILGYEFRTRALHKPSGTLM